MEISVIASGSNGNCCLVEKDDCSILIDAGKSGREIALRMDSLGKSIEHVDALLITHCHQDHLAGAGVLSRRFSLPVYITKKALSESRGRLGASRVISYSPEKRFRIKGIEVIPVQTSHNVSSCGFMIGSFGMFTDTGCITEQMKSAVSRLKCMLIESNHDIDMVVNSSYPYFLKNWILSDQGHLSNAHASQFVQENGKSLSQVLLGHLSGNNNTPELARDAFETLVRRKIDIGVCSRDKPSGTWIV